MQEVFKANTVLVGRCTFDKATGKAEYDNYSKYYPTPTINNKLFK